MIQKTIHKKWAWFWMRYAGISPLGRLCTYIATWLAPPYKARTYMARLNPKGYISPSAIISHDSLLLGKNVFIGDRVTIYKANKGGRVKIGNGSCIHQDTIIETGYEGNLTIGANTHIQPRCQLSAYLGSIFIGSDVQIAPNCAFYPYNHSFDANKLIKNQLLETKGNIIIEDDAWIGVGVIVLENVSIGKGSVIGAGAIVTDHVPELSIAVGNPARVMKYRKKFDRSV